VEDLVAFSDKIFGGDVFGFFACFKVFCHWFVEFLAMSYEP
jgi:hypothetical protein